MRSFLRTIIVICWWYRWKLEMLKGLLFWCVIFFSSGLANWGWKHLNPPIIKKRWEKIGMKLLVTMMVLNMPWVTHSWDWMSLSKSTSSKYQSSHPQNSSELKFENSSQHLRIRTKINKHIKQTSLMSSALFWTSIYIYTHSVPCPVWDLNLYGSTGCLRLFKKGRSHFWRKPNDMTTVPFASNTSTWKIERLLVMFGILISPFYIPGYHHQDHHHHSFSGFGHAFYFLVDIVRYINEKPSDLCIHFLLHLLLHLCELLRRRLRWFFFIHMIQVAVAPPSWDGTHLYVQDFNTTCNKEWKNTRY